MSNEMPPQLAQLSCWQSGILTTAQALHGGLTKDLLRSFEERGRWHRLHPGVYATFSGPLPRKSLLWAAVLRAGPGAALSYYSAAEVDHLIDRPVERIHLTIPQARRVDPISGVLLHRSERAWDARHPALTPPRTRIEETVLDLAAMSVTLDDACGWVSGALNRRLTTPARLRAALEQRHRMRWRPAVAELLSADAVGVHSVLEYRYLREVERPHGLPRGTRQALVRRGSRTEYRDVLYDSYGLAVELDGRFAHPADTRWRDIHRDNAAAADGLITLRYGWLDIHQHGCEVAAEVAAVLAHRGYREARPCAPDCPVPPADRPGLAGPG
jgi:hypothetical protein